MPSKMGERKAWQARQALYWAAARRQKALYWAAARRRKALWHTLVRAEMIAGAENGRGFRAKVML